MTKVADMRYSVVRWYSSRLILMRLVCAVRGHEVLQLDEHPNYPDLNNRLCVRCLKAWRARR